MSYFHKTLVLLSKVFPDLQPCFLFVFKESCRETRIKGLWLLVAVVQSLSCVQLSATPWTGTCQTSVSFTMSWSLLKLMSIESVMPSNHVIFCHLLLGK